MGGDGVSFIVRCVRCVPWFVRRRAGLGSLTTHRRGFEAKRSRFSKLFSGRRDGAGFYRGSARGAIRETARHGEAPAA